MSKVYLEDSTLTAIGNAIRGKTGESGLLLPSEMANKISSITSGGGWTLDDIKFYNYNSSSSASAYSVPSDFNANSTVLVWVAGITSGSTNQGLYGGLLINGIYFNKWEKDTPSQQRGGYYTVTDSSPSSPVHFIASLGYGVTDFSNLSNIRDPIFFRRNGLDWIAGTRQIVKVNANQANKPAWASGKGGFRMLYIP